MHGAESRRDVSYAESEHLGDAESRPSLNERERAPNQQAAARWRALPPVIKARVMGGTCQVTCRAEAATERPESIAFHAMPPLIAFAALGDHLGEYLGWSDLSWNKTLETVLGLWSAASGGADTTIREHLGLPPN